MARYNTLDHQAPTQTELEATKTNVGRSAHDFSHVHSGTTMIGLVAPILCMEVVPNEDIDINLSALIQLRNPLTRPLLNGMRVYFHSIYNKLTDLWEGAKNFLDTGRSGNINLQRPGLIWHTVSSDRNSSANANTPMSLLNFFGLPAEAFYPDAATDNQKLPLRLFQASRFYSNVASNPSDSNWISWRVLAASPDYFPADCAMAYQRNWRDYYCNKNLLQNNKYWFPDNEEDFILSYSCTEAVCIKYGDENLSGSLSSAATNILGYTPGTFSDILTFLSITPEPNNPATVTPSGDLNRLYPNLAGIKFRQFKGDRFTSAMPFPDLIRGTIPILGDFSSSSDTKYVSLTYPGYENTGWSLTGPGADFSSSMNTANLGLNYAGSSSYGRGLLKSTTTLMAIRALETFTVFKERMARTSGDYNDMIEAQYGVSPHVHDRTGTYIGGFYTDFNFSSVVQQSQSSDDSPLGTKAGDATAAGSGRIGHIHTTDFGWIQVYMSIVPDVFYTQGVPRQFSKKVQTDMYFPIFNNLAPQPILKKELYVSGNVSTDNDVFAYEDRYAEYKSAMNRVSGLMALPHNVAEYDASRIMARRFTSSPAFNSQFITLVPENVDMSVFSVQDEPPFDFQVGFDIRRVFPGPYVAIPGSLSSNLHA